MNNQEIDEYTKDRIASAGSKPSYDAEQTAYLRGILKLLAEIAKRLPEPSNQSGFNSPKFDTYEDGIGLGREVVAGYEQVFLFL